MVNGKAQERKGGNGSQRELIGEIWEMKEQEKKEPVTQSHSQTQNKKKTKDIQK